MGQFQKEYTAAWRSPRPVFEKYLPTLGAGPMLDYLEKIYPACHKEAHDLGRALFAQSGDLETALTRCDTRCTSGCMHGVVAEAFGASAADSITDQMKSFCAGGQMARLHKPGNCAHGIGHALMFVNAGDPRRSVDGCLGFEDEAMQYYCATGVFMERFQSARKPGSSPASLLAPCDSETLFPAACYRYKGAELLKLLGDRERVAAACGRLTVLQRHGCFHGLGHASIPTVYRNPLGLSQVCGGPEPDDRLSCIEGVIEKLADFNQDRARLACASLAGRLRSVCLESAERKMYSLDKVTFALYYDRQAIARRKAALGKEPPAGHAHTGHH